MDKWKYIEKEDLNFFFFLNSLREKKKTKNKKCFAYGTENPEIMYKKFNDI